MIVVGQIGTLLLLTETLDLEFCHDQFHGKGVDRFACTDFAFVYINEHPCQTVQGFPNLELGVGSL